jgi:hypothetical protein
VSYVPVVQSAKETQKEVFNSNKALSYLKRKFKKKKDIRFQLEFFKWEFMFGVLGAFRSTGSSVAVGVLDFENMFKKFHFQFTSRVI